ncbi:MAG TPA: methyltransferase domain-containing protein, partial [Myxococcaceae bacterium]
MLEERLRSILHQARQRFPILKSVYLRPPFLRPARGTVVPRAEELRDLQKVWEAQAKSDPLWAILSEQDKRGRGWKLEEFFAAGETQVAAWFERFAAAGIEVSGGSAVDFGCGVGRLTQALAKRFDHVTGVDISPTMVELARRLN